MKQIEKLKNMLAELAKKDAEVLREADRLLDSIENEPWAEKAEALRVEVETFKAKSSELEKKAAALQEESLELRAALLERVVEEKTGILKASRDRTRIYFSGNGDVDEIGNIESSARRRLAEVKASLKRELEVDAAPLLAEITDLEEKTSRLLAAKREALRASASGISGEFEAAYEAFSNRPVDQATVEKRINHGKWELKIGVSWLGRIGIVLVMIAAGLFAYYTRDLINVYAKGASIFAGGLLFLGAGEFLYRRRKYSFLKIFLGGGIALLYIAIFTSHFFLKSGGEPIMGFALALGLAAGTALLAILLSLRYASRTILALAAIGGHLPFAVFLLLFGFSGSQYYYAMIYLLVLDALVFGVCAIKDWPIGAILLFVLGAPSLAYLAMGSPAPGIGLGYAGLDLAIFMTASFFGPVSRKRDFRVSEIILLGLKTAIAAAIAYVLFPGMGLQDFEGLITLGLGFCFLGFGFLAGRLGTRDKRPRILFYITALAFAALVIPFQFGIAWLSLGWLVEAVLLIFAGYMYKIRLVKGAGWTILGLCAGAFIFLDFPFRMLEVFIPGQTVHGTLFNIRFLGLIPVFDLKYLSLTAAFIALSLFFTREQAFSRLTASGATGTFHKSFRVFTLVNLFVFACAIPASWFAKIMAVIEPPYEIIPETVKEFAGYAIASVCIRISSLMARRIRWSNDRLAPKLGTAFLVIADVLAVIMVLYPDRLALSEGYFFVTKIVGSAVFLALLVLAIMDLRRYLVFLSREKGVSLELYPLLMLLAISAAGTCLVMFQMEGVLPRGITVSLFYLVAAFVSIVYGFARKFTYVRFAGLGLIGIAMLVLLVNACLSADAPERIIAFLVFGLALIAISGIYASVSKRILGKKKD